MKLSSLKDVFTKEYTLGELLSFIHRCKDIDDLRVMLVALTETDDEYRWTPNVYDWIANYDFGRTLRAIKGRMKQIA